MNVGALKKNAFKTHFKELPPFIHLMDVEACGSGHSCMKNINQNRWVIFFALSMICNQLIKCCKWHRYMNVITKQNIFFSSTSVQKSIESQSNFPL